VRSVESKLLFNRILIINAFIYVFFHKPFKLCLLKGTGALLQWAPEFSLSAWGVPVDFEGILSWRALKFGIVRALNCTVLLSEIGVDFVSDDNMDLTVAVPLALEDGPDKSVFPRLMW
jgi:hypothetical protein